MNDQLDLFCEGRVLKKEGLDRVEENNQNWVRCMRSIAIEICEKIGVVSTDDLRLWADHHRFHPAHPNAWGSVFRGKQWIPYSYKKSRYPSNHARRITVWRYKEDKKICGAPKKSDIMPSQENESEH